MSSIVNLVAGGTGRVGGPGLHRGRCSCPACATWTSKAAYRWRRLALAALPATAQAMPIVRHLWQLAQGHAAGGRG